MVALFRDELNWRHLGDWSDLGGDGIRQCLSNQLPMFHEAFFSTVQFVPRIC